MLLDLLRVEFVCRIVVGLFGVVGVGLALCGYCLSVFVLLAMAAGGWFGLVGRLLFVVFDCFRHSLGLSGLV